jgi:hypothetical protein
MIYTTENLNLNDGASVISSAQKFILPIPNLHGNGEPLVYPDGDDAGKQIADWEGNPIGDEGVVFFNAKDQAWQAVPADGTGVVIMNQATEEQAADLHQKIDTVLQGTGRTISQLTLEETKEIITYAAQDLALDDMYNSDTGFIESKMTPVGPPSKAEAFGVYKRDDRDICQAIYISGQGEFQGPAATPQKFEDGAVILQQGDSVRLIQPDAFEETYRNSDGSKLTAAELPIQGNTAESLLRQNKNESWGVATINIANEFDKCVNNQQQAADILVVGGEAFVEASKRNGEDIPLSEGVNRAIAWLGYHDAGGRHTEQGKSAIELAEERVTPPKPLKL